jgi:precorrin-2 dehydrogenase/sirohydrochlorin ferrochelatase
MSKGYPVVLQLEGKRVLVLGQGREAEEKSSALAECGALVTRIERPFQAGDCEGFFLVVAASPDRSQNAAVFAEAERLGILVNCVDDPPHCRFTFASIHRQGDLLLAVSTQGACPALAVRLRQRLAAELGPEYAEFLELMRELRSRMARTFPNFSKRREIWYRLVDSPALALLREGRKDEALALIESILRNRTLS